MFEFDRNFSITASECDSNEEDNYSDISRASSPPGSVATKTTMANGTVINQIAHQKLVSCDALPEYSALHQTETAPLEDSVLSLRITSIYSISPNNNSNTERSNSPDSSCSEQSDFLSNSSSSNKTCSSLLTTKTKPAVPTSFNNLLFRQSVGGHQTVNVSKNLSKRSAIPKNKVLDKLVENRKYCVLCRFKAVPETFKTKGALKFHLRIKHSKEIDQQQEDHEVMSEPETSERSLELKSPTLSEPSRSPPPR